ncbi:MAG: tetratricopeptide repeat protein [Acidobacteriota bacterium]|nr:tetratricopeptide repeat protein [Acidobacteriota bacterium]
MKRTLALWLGVLALSLTPAFGQAPAASQAQAMGKIHGQITNPSGAPQTTGSVSLSTDGGHTAKYTFPVNSAGQYSGEAAPGTYMAIYRQPDTPPDKMVDSFNNVKIVAGEDTLQDFDMSRAEFVAKLPEETRKQLEDMRKHNSEALKANEVIKHLNEDLRQVNEDQKEAGQAQQLAQQQLGANASRADLEAKEAEIKTAKYTDMETLMTKDTAAKPDASILWAQLGQAKLGLKKYDEAETAFKKALEVDAASKKPNPEIVGMADAGLGEVYARTGKVAEANAAYDAAAKANPAKAAMYLRNEAVIFFQAGNGDAQVAAAQEAIKTSPDDAVLYYLIGQGLVQKATVDPKTQRIVLPPGCADAYQKYLELAPDGPYSADAKGILQQAGEKITSSYKAGRKK